MNRAQLGSQMAAEMGQQPAVLAALAQRLPAIADQVRAVAGRTRGVAFVARGSSDHAALLGRYAMDLQTGLPTSLVAPSLHTVYGRQPTGFEGWVVVALSQSGRTPEIVDLAQRFTSAGATVVSITNDEDSPLAAVGAVSIDLRAGQEKAVPATKTVSAQMLAVMAGVNGLSEPATAPDLSSLSDQAAAVLDDQTSVSAAAAELAPYDRLAVVARGLCYPAAKETALKLQETTGAMAHGFSTADFRHGPIAVCGPQSPAVLLAGSSLADHDTVDLRAILQTRDSPIVVVGTSPDADVWLPTGSGAAECVLATIRGQQLALAICRARGVDPDAPAGLNKITLTH